MRRINVLGSSGAGKTTLGRRRGLPHLKLDAIHHLPGCTPRPREELRAEVAEFVARPAWVIDGNDSSVRDLLWARADIAWSWTRHAKHRRRFDAALDDPQWSHVRFVRLPSRRAVDAFVERR